MDQSSKDGESRDTAPIVVVGVPTSDTRVRKPISMHGDHEIPLQLRQLVVRVENVLRGQVADKIMLFTTSPGPVASMGRGLWASPGAEDYLMAKYTRLAMTERPPVKTPACVLLWMWGHDPALIRYASDAMRDADCRCVPISDGNPDCRPAR